DARSQHGLHSGWHLYVFWIPLQAIGATPPAEYSSLDESADTLLDEERIAFSPGNQKLLEPKQLPVRAQQRSKHRMDAFIRQRLEPQLLIVALASPSLLIFRTIAASEQDTCGWTSFDKAMEQRLCDGIVRLEVIEGHKQRLILALPNEQFNNRLQAEAQLLRRFQIAPLSVLNARV